MEQMSRDQPAIEGPVIMYAQAGKVRGSSYKAAEAAVLPKRDPNVMSQGSIL
jgi:hypothetical protein